ncbi:DUF2671 domain-containing protein [Rickettsia typhi]|uniref:DUF2671 domain-containing protein n=2 Tax=Rickettsia typhi TaxID=785 RepID=Q68XF4_RICTY|nr:DUF2671 domain-containing protein [Rickettsia typhi]AAU03688.1 rickettsial conserved hypothetical protein [Rickettsia typhi str. Wilmington]AFE54065.1 hypothetical protein RTTH1527_01000 [Rickettsia typhi str. TH1527]AFE54904.1 hypothetical protein RTB9991CWPP_01005 [Rickettsia typhi str. B9991CWPP]
MQEKELSNNFLEENKSKEDNSPFSDIKYICQASLLITDSIRKGYDVTQFSNGDINVREIRIVNVHYNWNSEKGKFVKTNQIEFNNNKGV